MTAPVFPAAPVPLASRAVPATFPQDNDAALVWEKAFRDVLAGSVPFYEEAATAATSAVSASVAAVGAANFKGAWSGLTGALNIPASVSHSSKVWVLTVNLADVTASEPTSDNGNWLNVTPEEGGVGSNVQTFTSSGNWTKPAGVTWVLVEAGGGGGGGAKTDTTAVQAGGGGGAGVQRLFLASDLGSTETVTIGAGGNGAGVNNAEFGVDGGDTAFGAHLTAKGGKRGIGNSGGDGGGGERGGTINASGTQRGDGGYSSGGGGQGSEGSGGSCVIGGGGGGGTNNTTGNPGGVSQFGGNGGAGVGTASVKGGDGAAPGGGGGASSNNGNGGDGAAGRMVVKSW